MGKFLDSNGISYFWNKLMNFMSDNIPTATNERIGGIKTGYTPSDKNYPLTLDSNGKAYVNVPWTDTTYNNVSTDSAGLVSELPTKTIMGSYSPIEPSMQVFCGDGKWKALDIGIDLLSTENKLFVRYCDNSGRCKKFSADIPKASYVVLDEKLAYVYNGFMLGTDKYKLDGIAEGANNYSLPTASSEELGGVKTGYTQNNKNYPIQTDSDGNAYVNVPWSDTNTTYKVVSTSANGLMPKLPTTNIVSNNMSFVPEMQVLTGDGKYKVFQFAYNQITDQISLGLYDSSVGYGSVTATIPVADIATNGLMSMKDKTKLNGIAEGANNYVLPKAAESTLGGIKTGFSQSQNDYALHVDVNGNGYVQVPWENTTYSAVGTTGDPGLMTSTDKAKLDGIDVTTLPYLIDLGTSSPFETDTWLNLSTAIYTKLYAKTFTQQVYIRAKVGNDNMVSPAVIDAAGNSKVYITFFNALGNPYRLEITLNTSKKATAVTIKTVSHSWTLVE